MYVLTTFSHLVNCVLVRFLSTSEERSLYEHEFDQSNAPKFFVARDSVFKERPCFSVTSPRPVYCIKLSPVTTSAVSIYVTGIGMMLTPVIPILYPQHDRGPSAWALLLSVARCTIG